MTNNKLTDAELAEILSGVVDGVQPTTHEIAMARELQERRKADSAPVATLDVQSGRPDGNRFALVFSSAAHKLPDDVYFLYHHAQPAPVIPVTLPCAVELKPGLIIGKGCKTETLLTALQRRADYYDEIDAKTPEERAEHDANIAAFKAMLPPSALDSKQVGELTMWVKRLAHSLRNARPYSKLHSDAMDYLCSNGLISVGDVLR